MSINKKIDLQNFNKKIAPPQKKSQFQFRQKKKKLDLKISKVTKKIRFIPKKMVGGQKKNPWPKKLFQKIIFPNFNFVKTLKNCPPPFKKNPPAKLIISKNYFSQFQFHQNKKKNWLTNIFFKSPPSKKSLILIMNFILRLTVFSAKRKEG